MQFMLSYADLTVILHAFENRNDNADKSLASSDSCDS